MLSEDDVGSRKGWEEGWTQDWDHFFIICAQVFVLHVSLCTTCMPDTHRDQKRMLAKVHPAGEM